MGPNEPPPTETRMPADLARWLAERHLALPALLLVESARPLGWLAGQLALVAAPLARGFLPGDPLGGLAAWLEQPERLAELSDALAAESERR